MRDAAAAALGARAGPRSAVAETGVIGVPLPLDDVLAGVERVAGGSRERGGAEFAEAIMTTDRAPKALHACAPRG